MVRRLLSSTPDCSKAKSGEKFQLVRISFPIGIVRSSVPFHHRTRSEQNQRTIEHLQAKMKSLSDETFKAGLRQGKR